MNELLVPGDKSITHRALMLGALASGTSRITGALVAGDTRSTARVLRALRARIPELTNDTIGVVGVGLSGLQQPIEELDCGNSGTTARLMMGIVAGAGLAATFTGDDSLRSRPMRRIVEPLARMGAQIDGEGEHLPLRLTGAALRPIEYVTPHASAQIKSALLLAGLVGGVPVLIKEPYTSRDHTERMLRAAGVRIEESSAESGEHTVHLEPAATIAPLELRVPGDISSAAFLLGAALLGAAPPPIIRKVGVNPTRTGFLDVVRMMGGCVRLKNERLEGGEPVADLIAEPAELRATEIGGALIPRLIDEIPILAVLAARAAGRTVIRDAGELRVKESDRIRVVARNLGRLGVAVEELPDGMVIHGTARPLEGTVETAGDHRIAMAFGVLAAQRGNRIRINDPDIVRISFPDFWQQLHDHRD